MTLSASEIRDRFGEVLAGSDRRTSPYRHWLLTDVLPPSVAALMTALPIAPPEAMVFNGRRETNNAARIYFDAANQKRYPVVGALAEAFQAEETVRMIEAECETSLKGTNLRIEFCQDTDGFWLEPHTDIGVKRFTMLVYLSQGKGSEDWGTDIYDGERRWLGRAPSPFNAGLIFVPGPETWHGVEPRPIDGVRRSLIINFVGPEWRARQELAFPNDPL